MDDLHIDDFYKDIALIWLRLYRYFPRKTILYVDDISGADQPDEFGLHSERFLAGFSAMVWLGEEGYLRYESPIKQEALDQAVLTERSLILLSTRPDTKSDSHITQLEAAVRSGSSTKIRAMVETLLTYHQH